LLELLADRLPIAGQWRTTSQHRATRQHESQVVVAGHAMMQECMLTLGIASLNVPNDLFGKGS
jgi:hypothetical protein